MPTLPNSAWFFFASPENYLTLYDQLPSSGKLAATFSSSFISPYLISILTPLTVLAFIPALGRIFRRALRRYIRQDACSLNINTTDWHTYQIYWKSEKVDFNIDGIRIFSTNIVPNGTAGLVIWIDNQYASFSPEGKLRFGTLISSEECWIEIEDLSVSVDK